MNLADVEDGIEGLRVVAPGWAGVVRRLLVIARAARAEQAALTHTANPCDQIYAAAAMALALDGVTDGEVE